VKVTYPAFSGSEESLWLTGNFLKWRCFTPTDLRVRLQMDNTHCQYGK
jgi:hypothetical protein